MRARQTLREREKKEKGRIRQIVKGACETKDTCPHQINVTTDFLVLTFCKNGKMEMYYPKSRLLDCQNSIEEKVNSTGHGVSDLFQEIFYSPVLCTSIIYT